MGNAHLAGRQLLWRCHCSCCPCVYCEATVNVPSLAWAYRAPTSRFHFDLHLLTTNNCVSKPVYQKVQTVMGVSRATGVRLLQAQQYEYCAELKIRFLITKSLWTSLGSSKDPKQPTANSSLQFHSSVLSSPHWQPRVPLLMGRNSLARIQAAWLRTSVTPWTSETRANRRQSRNRAPEPG